MGDFSFVVDMLGGEVERLQAEVEDLDGQLEERDRMIDELMQSQAAVTAELSQKLNRVIELLESIDHNTSVMRA